MPIKPMTGGSRRRRGIFTGVTIGMGYFLEEDFRARIDKIKDWLGDGVLPTSTTNKSSKRWLMSTSPFWGWWLVSPCRKLPTRSLHCPDNYALVESAFLHLKEKGVNALLFMVFRNQAVNVGPLNAKCISSACRRRKVSRSGLSGVKTAPENWQHAQNRLADWLQTCHRKPGLLPLLTPGRGIFCNM